MTIQQQHTQSKNRFVEHLLKIHAYEYSDQRNRAASSAKSSHWLSKQTNTN